MCQSVVYFSELPTFEDAPELSVNVDEVSKEVLLSCVTEGLQQENLVYRVDWYWGTQQLADQPMTRQQDGQYIAVLSEQNFTRLAFGQEVIFTFLAECMTEKQS